MRNSGSRLCDWFNVEGKKGKGLKDDSQFLRCGYHSLTLDLLLYRGKDKKAAFFFNHEASVSFFFLFFLSCRSSAFL